VRRGAGWLSGDDEVVVINTGSGLKYPQAARVDLVALTRDERLPRHRRSVLR